jgi:hypothetical protein
MSLTGLMILFYRLTSLEAFLPDSLLITTQNHSTGLRYIALARTAQKTSITLLCLSLPEKRRVLRAVPSNGCCNVACLHSCYLAMGLRVTIL